MSQITTVEELEAVIGTPLPATRDKARAMLHELDRLWISACPLVFIATSDAEGRLDVSPKGDPAGFVHVLDDRTIVIPERPGNRRADGYHNLLGNPHIGLIFVIPGRGDTLRINGTATMVTDAPYFDELIVKGHRPVLATVVEVDEIFHHCSKAFLRSRTWHPEEWDLETVPRRAVIAQQTDRAGEDLAVLDEYYGPKYAEKIYG